MREYTPRSRREDVVNGELKPQEGSLEWMAEEIERLTLGLRTERECSKRVIVQRDGLLESVKLAKSIADVSGPLTQDGFKGISAILRTAISNCENPS